MRGARDRSGALGAARAIALVAAAATLVATASPSAADERSADRGTPRWVVRDFGPTSDSSVGMVVSPDGSILYAGAKSGNQMAVAAHDAATGAIQAGSGQELWSETY